MPRAKPVLACDCETDKFKHGRVPKPFVWGLMDARGYMKFDRTEDFVAELKERDAICYAHNGGKFDFVFLLPFLGETKIQVIGGRMVAMMLGRCELRDSYSIIPEPLALFGGKKEIEYWKMEASIRWRYKEEIETYLYHDCKTLFDTVTAFRAIAGTKTTIAANALAFSKNLGVDPGRTNHYHDEKFRRYFYGGRCECFQPGTHRNVKLLDIRSAYPRAMMDEHATGTHFDIRHDFDGMDFPEIERSFIHLECTSDGAFPIRTQTGLIFPHEYNEFKITGWEYVVAKEFGLIRDEKILNVRVPRQTINFTPYVQHWYAFKSAHDKKTQPVEYHIGKRMMNALYGKCSQGSDFYDYKIVPAGTKPDREHGWELCTEFENHEIHKRESLWRFKHEVDKATGQVFSTGEKWKQHKAYYNTATGSSITGATRARLLRAMCQVGRHNVIYCDTDSIFTKEGSDLSALSFSEKIGDWELEDTAPTGHFAGKKLYGVKLSSDGKYKIASKGVKMNIITLEKLVHGEVVEEEKRDDKAAYETIEKLLSGDVYLWNNPAPTFGLGGSPKWVSREIRATAQRKETNAP